MHGRAVLLVTVLAVWAKCDGFKQNKCNISKLMLNPVFCASDGKTYTSFCKLEKAKERNRHLTVTHIGPCAIQPPGYYNEEDEADYDIILPPKVPQGPETSNRIPHWKECSSKRGCPKGPKGQVIISGGHIYNYAAGSDIYYQGLKKNHKLKKRHRGGIDISNGAQNNNNINARGNRGKINVVNDANNNNNINGGGYHGDINIDNEATNNNNINADGYHGDINLDNAATNNNNFNRLKMNEKTRLLFKKHLKNQKLLKKYQGGVNINNGAQNNNNINSRGNRGGIKVNNNAGNNNNFNGGGYYRDISVDNAATNNNNINAHGFDGDIYLDNVATNNNNLNRLKINQKSRLHYYSHLKKNHKLNFNKYGGDININSKATNNNNINSHGNHGNINIRNDATNNNNFNRG